MERVMLTMTADLLQVVDSQAQQRKQNRSQFVHHVLRLLRRSYKWNLAVTITSTTEATIEKSSSGKAMGNEQ